MHLPDSLASEPVADIVCVTVVQRDSYTVVKDHLEIFQEVAVDEVACRLELPVDVIVGVGVVEVNS